MADEARNLASAGEPEESAASHPVIAAAEEKLRRVEAGEYVDVNVHQDIRAAHLGESAYTAEQLAARKGGDENG